MGIAVAGLFLNVYEPTGVNCWIGSQYGVYRLALFYIPIWLMMGFLAAAMLVMYCYVLKREKACDKWRTSIGDATIRTRSNRVRNQALLYVGCMYMTFLFGTITRAMQFLGKTPPKAIIMLFMVFFPLQGFFNLVVYL